nr:hypothetical protein [Sphingomonas endophytica]
MKLTRAGGKQGDVAATALHPIPRSVSHKAVQVLVALDIENCPPLSRATSIGFTTRAVPFSMIRSGMYPASDAVGVGQEEEPSPAMTSADFSRREQARFCAIAQSAKVAGDVGTSQRQVTFDVFAPDPLGPGLADDAGDVGPEMTRIRVATSPTGVAEGLAGITGRDDMNSAAERSRVEGSQVVPDRSLTQGRVRHPGHESGRCVAVPFDESHSPITGFGDVQAEVEASISGAERDAPEVVGFGGVFGT